MTKYDNLTKEELINKCLDWEDEANQMNIRRLDAEEKYELVCAKNKLYESIIYKLITAAAAPKNEYYTPRVIKVPYKHTIKSLKGNLQHTKHVFHRNKNTLLEVTFPAGTLAKTEQILTFKTITSAKVYIKANIPMLRDSALTNISSAVNGVSERFKDPDKKGHAYGLYFRNIEM